MYQFTTTNIINSALDSNGVTAKFAATADVLNVARVGAFKTTGIVSINKRSYYAGVKEVAQVTVPTITAKTVVRATLDIRLYDQTYADYANVMMYFKKPVYVEVLATGTAGTDATNLKNELNKLKDRFGLSYVVATTSGANLIITATDVNQQIFNIDISKEIASPNSIIQPDYESVGTSFAVTTVGHPGFGDDNWMARRILLPTADNVRYFGISKDERPILGGQYTQYTLRYKIEKDGTDGINGGGTSITTHVFYVLSTLVAAFEVELDKLTGITYGIAIAVTDDTLANSATTQATVTNATGAVTFSVTSGTSATVDAAGLITADGAIDGATVVRATDVAGAYAEVTITVA